MGLRLTILRSFFVIPFTEIHLNGPLVQGFHLNVLLGFVIWCGVGDAVGVLEAPTLGPFGFRFSRVSPPTFSAAHTDLEYSENHARDVGPTVSLHMRGHGE